MGFSIYSDLLHWKLHKHDKTELDFLDEIFVYGFIWKTFIYKNKRNKLANYKTAWHSFDGLLISSGYRYSKACLKAEWRVVCSFCNRSFLQIHAILWWINFYSVFSILLKNFPCAYRLTTQKGHVLPGVNIIQQLTNQQDASVAT